MTPTSDQSSFTRAEPAGGEAAHERPMPSITEELARHGYGHRSSNIDGKREVFRVSNGEIVGVWDAQDAAFFLAEQDDDQ